MEGTVRRLVAGELTEESWAPFGWLPVSDTDERDGRHHLEFAWDDAHANFISHTRHEVPHTDTGMLCERLYRHDTHTQVLMVMNCDAVVVVAPAATSFTGPSDADAVRAFLLRPLDTLALHRGTWHWGPFPVDADEVRLFNVQGHRYVDDNVCVDLAGYGIGLEVVPPR